MVYRSCGVDRGSIGHALATLIVDRGSIWIHRGVTPSFKKIIRVIRVIKVPRVSGH